MGIDNTVSYEGGCDHDDELARGHVGLVEPAETIAQRCLADKES